MDYEWNICMLASRRYDVNSDTWTDLPAMNEGRHKHGSVVLANQIYAIGGRNPSEKFLGSVERYDIAHNRWSAAASLITPRAEFGCVVLRNLIYVIGGEGDDGFLHTIECYDGSIDRWCRVKIIKQILHTLIQYFSYFYSNYTISNTSSLSLSRSFSLPLAHLISDWAWS